MQSKRSKEEHGPDCTVSNTEFSSVTLNELAMKARERTTMLLDIDNHHQALNNYLKQSVSYTEGPGSPTIK